MAQRIGVITLQSFLRKYFLKKNIDEDQFHRYHVIAADGLRDLSIHHLPVSKTTTLSIDGTNFTSDFPDDFIDYTFIAIEDDGRWWTFTRDDKMSDRTITDITGADLGTFIQVVGPGQTGGENNYWFKPDYENRRFLFSGVSASDTVILNYISTGVESVAFDSTNDIQFPVYAEDSMEKYLRWQECEWDNGPAGECERRKDQYEDSVRMLRNIHNSTLDEIRDIWLRSSNRTFIRR